MKPIYLREGTNPIGEAITDMGTGVEKGAFKVIINRDLEAELIRKLAGTRQF